MWFRETEAKRSETVLLSFTKLGHPSHRSWRTSAWGGFLSCPLARCDVCGVGGREGGGVGEGNGMGNQRFYAAALHFKIREI